MGCDTKLFVTYGKERLFDAIHDVICHLNIYVRAELDKYWEENTPYQSRIQFLSSDDCKERKVWSNGVSYSGYNMDCISLDFKVGEERSLKILPDCSCDYSDTYDGDKIIFSLGCWGKSEEIMMVVAKAVAKYGDVYYDYNDCDDIDFEKLGEMA